MVKRGSHRRAPAAPAAPARVSPPAAPPATRPEDGEDIIERLFAHLLLALPELADPPGRTEVIKAALRQEFGGAATYVRKRPMSERAELQEAARRLLGSMSPTQIARVLGVGRATVYRALRSGPR